MGDEGIRDLERSSDREFLLIVEDDPLIAKCLSRGLEADYPLLIADSGEKAIAMLDEHEAIAGVLSDLNMPDCSGIELRRRILAKYPKLSPHYLFMTGGSTSPQVVSFLESCRDRWIEKPFTFVQLREFLRASGLPPLPKGTKEVDSAS